MSKLLLREATASRTCVLAPTARAAASRSSQLRHWSYNDPSRSGAARSALVVLAPAQIGGVNMEYLLSRE